jgi:hypothetical protein
LMRKIILNIHMYSGLLSFSFLLIFGISVLIFNHPSAFTHTPSSVKTWTQPLVIPPLARTDGQNATEKLQMVRENNAAILKALGSFATPSAATDGAWTDADTYHAHFLRPGKEYQIDVRPSQNSATITQSRMTFWMMTAELHANSYTVVAYTWPWYLELCTIGVFAAGITGIYLWPARARERRIGIVVLGVSGAFSIALMLLVSIHG